MSVIVSERFGYVKVIEKMGFPAVVDIGGFWGLIPVHTQVFITGLKGSNNAGVQFMHTLRQFIYVYVFGERIGDLVVTGKTVLHSCPLGGSGVSTVSSYYYNEGIARSGSPVIVAISNVAVKGFITGMDASIQDPRLPFSDFSLKLKTFI